MTTQSVQPPTTSTSRCPCGSGKTFGDCCEPLLKQERKAETPGELMRSRFTAHVVRDYRHLHRTFLGTTDRPFVEEVDGGEVTWTRLEIHHEEAGAKPDTGIVDFTAYYQDGDAEQALHEKSEFLRRAGTWFYARAVRLGPAPIKSTAPKVGRNDPCRCGSGKKYKHCCGR